MTNWWPAEGFWDARDCTWLPQGSGCSRLPWNSQEDHLLKQESLRWSFSSNDISWSGKQMSQVLWTVQWTGIWRISVNIYIKCLLFDKEHSQCGPDIILVGWSRCLLCVFHTVYCSLIQINSCGFPLYFHGAICIKRAVPQKRELGRFRLCLCLLRKMLIHASLMERLCWSPQGNSTSIQIIAACVMCQGLFFLGCWGQIRDLIERIPVFLMGDYLFGQALYIMQVRYGLITAPSKL